MSLTDHGECGGHLAAAKAAQEYGLGFIPGIEAYWAFPETVQMARNTKKQPHPSHICMLAKDKAGLRNLWALSSLAYTPEYFYYKPIATPELMRQYSEGMFASDGCLLTDLADKIEAGDEDGAKQILGTLLSIYRERFYCEIHTWQYLDASTPERTALNARMRRLNHAKVRLAHELSIPLVVVNDSHHSYPEHWVNKELVWAFNTSGDNNDKLQASLGEMAQKADHIMDEQEIYHWMGLHGIAENVIAEAIRNSYDIAQQCQVEITPTLSLPRMGRDEHDDFNILMDSCEEGFRKYVTDEGLDEEKYAARLHEELSMIADKRFSGYFNMLKDCTHSYRSGAWSQYVKQGAPKEPILLGFGRGSAGGSLVGYLLGIHMVDPIKYGTLFSRFMSPGRRDLPDIDIDIPQSQRKDALAYLPARFGEENVCAIGTFTRNGPKATIKDMGRALGITKLQNGYTDLQAISDHIDELERLRKDSNDPDTEDLTWSELIETKGGSLIPYRQKYPELFDLAEQMVGTIRQSGVHASGILVSGSPLLGTIPMRRTKNKVMTTQFDMHAVEELGGAKLDWLGLRHLDTLTVARNLIYERHQVWIDYDRTGLSVPPNCPKVIRLGSEHFSDPAIWVQIDQGKTTGIFQVETSLATEAAIKLRPRNELDIADLVSIIRPGVADAGLKDVYLRRRDKQEPVTYDHPMMERFVGPSWASNTYGVIVYQEQIVECVQKLAGFTPDEADSLRKAVGKKLMDKLVLFKEKFIQGCLNNQEFAQWLNDERKSTQVANKIWLSIEASGKYAFNYSHGIGYSLISTAEIWVKHYYPQEYLVALMQTDSSNITKYLREARRQNIPILPPDINLSGRKFTIVDQTIRYGLDSVDKVGAAATRDILRHRPYTSMEDYLSRAKEGADKKVATNLILIGAFDSFGSRPEMLQALQNFRARKGLAQSTLDDPVKLAERISSRIQQNPEDYQIDIPDFDNSDVVYNIEKALVGTHITVDPMGPYLSYLEDVISDPLDVLQKAKGELFLIGGQVASINLTVTKRGRNPGQSMAHITILWNDAEFRVVVFPGIWAQTKSLFKVGAPVVVEVKKLDNGCCAEGVVRLDLMERND